MARFIYSVHANSVTHFDCIVTTTIHLFRPYSPLLFGIVQNEQIGGKKYSEDADDSLREV